jgi:hypothetical protein
MWPEHHEEIAEELENHGLYYKFHHKNTDHNTIDD